MSTVVTFQPISIPSRGINSDTTEDTVLAAPNTSATPRNVARTFPKVTEWSQTAHGGLCSQSSSNLHSSSTSLSDTRARTVDLYANHQVSEDL
ncbi:hypothetical protein SeMB42_g00546 [Synchytrium endobioticum]|uniref:Uncharacterized protein n=1 Tax=Synchytrium endobioticum TaxID=286115 RepID=A0A507DFG7_9FUNG|nr:hypothetical protein SeLEV6574_g01172 [Synchytrium endobioticum]TPX53900.1 hypothetical protein SeMB42_g00546 [Synchytrium endobioticum]